jgi:glycerol-3-phosphate dehydrogenase (NAD(P)+)
VSSVSILGAGSWGIAVAVLLAENGNQVTLWEFDPQAAARLANEREEPVKLPGITIPPEIGIENDLSVVVRKAEALVFAVPVQLVRSD